jgi:hypothetical protein
MYYFEYNKEGYLERYFEKYDTYDCYKDYLMCYCLIKDYSVTKIEENGKYRHVIKYNEPIKVVHRFECGESWISVVQKESEVIKSERQYDKVEKKYPSYYQNNTKQHNFYYPTIKTQIAFEDDKLSHLKFSIHPNLINNWKNLINL